VTHSVRPALRRRRLPPVVSACGHGDDIVPPAHCVHDLGEGDPSLWVPRRVSPLEFEKTCLIPNSARCPWRHQIGVADLRFEDILVRLQPPFQGKERSEAILFWASISDKTCCTSTTSPSRMFIEDLFSTRSSRSREPFILFRGTSHRIGGMMSSWTSKTPDKGGLHAKYTRMLGLDKGFTPILVPQACSRGPCGG
jgi:hypothetical protein